MLWLKVLTPVVVLVVGIIHILLERRWHDKKTRAHPKTRVTLIAMMCLATGLTIAVIVNDQVSSQQQAEELQKQLDQEATRAAERENKAHAQRVQLQTQVATLEEKLEPFIEVARARHPTLRDDAALERFSQELSNLRQQSNRLSGDLEALRRFSSVARLNFFGVTGTAGKGLKESSPISRALDAAYVQQSGKVYPRCDEQSLEKFESVARDHSDFPFAHYALALCLREADDDAWRKHAERALAIFSQTTRVAGHHPHHDQAYAELRGYLGKDR